MPLVIPRSQLCRGVSAVIAGCARKFTIAWHELMLLDFDGEILTLATGNGGGRCWFRIHIADAGCPPFRISVKAAELNAVCSAVRSNTLTLSEDGSKLHIVSDRGRLSLAICGEWPSLPTISGEPVAKIAAGDLIYALRASSPIVDADSERFALGSIQIKFSEAGSFVYATDGRRASEVSVSSECNTDASFLIPATMASLVSGVIDKSSDGTMVSVYDCENSVAFVSDGGVAYVTQTASRFPDVSKLIREGFESKDKSADFTLSVADVKSAIREAIIGYESGADWASSVCLACRGPQLTVLSNAASANDMLVGVPVSDSSGQGAVKIDHMFFNQALAACGDNATVRIVGDGRMLVRQGNYRSVIMGMELAGADLSRCAKAMEVSQPLLV